MAEIDRLVRPVVVRKEPVRIHTVGRKRILPRPSDRPDYGLASPQLARLEPAHELEPRCGAFPLWARRAK